MYTLNNIDFDNSDHRDWLVFAKRLYQDLLINNKDRYGVEQKADIILDPGMFVDDNKIYDLKKQESQEFKIWYNDWKNGTNLFWGWHSDELNIPDTYKVDYKAIITPGSGFYAYEAWCKLGRPDAKIIIYDYNPVSIKFQNKLHSNFNGDDYDAFVNEFLDQNKEFYTPFNNDDKIFDNTYWNEYLQLDRKILETNLYTDNIVFSYVFSPHNGKTFFSISDIFDYPESILEYGYDKLQQAFLNFIRFGTQNIGRPVVYFEKPRNSYFFPDTNEERDCHEHLGVMLEDINLFIYSMRFDYNLNKYMKDER